jgi:hypothetical protein
MRHISEFWLTTLIKSPRKQSDVTTFQIDCRDLADDHNRKHASWIYVDEAWPGDELTVRISVLDPRSNTLFKGKTLLRSVGAKFGGSNGDAKSAGSSRGPSKA